MRATASVGAKAHAAANPRAMSFMIPPCRALWSPVEPYFAPYLAQGQRRRDNAGMAPRLELFRFRYRDPRTGKWLRARYRADRNEIVARYVEWQILGEAEIRDVDPDARYFTPHTSPLDAAVRRCNERPPELAPAIDAAEAFLVAVFLRRYVTYCARRGSFAAMNGAARLFAAIRASAA